MDDPAAGCESCKRVLEPKEAMSWYRKRYMDGDRDPFASDDKFLCPGCYQALPEGDRAAWLLASEPA